MTHDQSYPEIAEAIEYLQHFSGQQLEKNPKMQAVIATVIAAVRAVSDAERIAKADYKMGWWMAAALEDPDICDEMRTVIVEWFEAHQPGLKIQETDGCFEAVRPGTPQPVPPAQTIMPFDVMGTIDPDYAASFEREICQLCGAANGHRLECVKIQRDHIDAQTQKEPSTLAAMIASIYDGMDAEDYSFIDFEWARQRGYILPNNGTGQLAQSSREPAAWQRTWLDGDCSFTLGPRRPRAVDGTTLTPLYALPSTSLSTPPASVTEVCDGGVDPGWDECPKCGATMDDACAFSSPACGDAT